MQRSALCRSRRELSNAYLLAKIGVDTAENEPLEVWGEISIQYSLHSLVSAEQLTERNLEGCERANPMELIGIRPESLQKKFVRFDFHERYLAMLDPFEFR